MLVSEFVNELDLLWFPLQIVHKALKRTLHAFIEEGMEVPHLARVGFHVNHTILHFLLDEFAMFGVTEEYQTSISNRGCLWPLFFALGDLILEGEVQSETTEDARHSFFGAD